VAQCTLAKTGANEFILVKSDEFENSYDYVAARSAAIAKDAKLIRM